MTRRVLGLRGKQVIPWVYSFIHECVYKLCSHSYIPLEGFEAYMKKHKDDKKLYRDHVHEKLIPALKILTPQHENKLYITFLLIIKSSFSVFLHLLKKSSY